MECIVCGAPAEAGHRHEMTLAEMEAMDRRLRRKRAPILSGLVRRRDWSGALALLNSTERHYALARWWVGNRLDAGELREVLRDNWTGIELASRNGWQEIVLEMFHAASPVMDAELPAGDGFVIFRGQGRGMPPGISWTLDPKVADLFTRYRFHAPDPVVLRGYVHRQDVLGYFTDRGEAEIIADPEAIRLDGESAVDS